MRKSLKWISWVTGTVVTVLVVVSIAGYLLVKDVMEIPADPSVSAWDTHIVDQGTLEERRYAASIALDENGNFSETKILVRLADTRTGKNTVVFEMSRISDCPIISAEVAVNYKQQNVNVLINSERDSVRFYPKPEDESEFWRAFRTQTLMNSLVVDVYANCGDADADIRRDDYEKIGPFVFPLAGATEAVDFVLGVDS